MYAPIVCAVNPELIDSTGLHSLANRLESRGLLPHVVRRLLAATPGVSGLVMPAEEGIVAPGFDGVIDGGPGSPWVPVGASVWEMGTDADPGRKAQRDYDKRVENPLNATPAETAFVFVTPRRWAAGQAWALERRDDEVWRDVAVIDGEGLHGWLESVPDVHVWLSERLDFRPLQVRTLALASEMLAARTQPPLPASLLLAGREREVAHLRVALAGDPSVIAVRAGSREEAVAFIATALRLDGAQAGAAESQPLLVRDAVAFERLALAARPMTLVVPIDGAEVGHAVARGHRVILALGAGDFERTGVIALPRPDRWSAREALEEAGVPFERADWLAALARRSFAALQREMSVARGGALPIWAAGNDAPLLAALLLLGGWENVDGDHAAIQEVAGHEAARIEERLMMLGRSDDPPWTRSGGSWRLVSPDDSFVLVGELLDDRLLHRWRAAAIGVLGEVDPRLGMSSAERMLADLQGEHRWQHSGALRHGVAQATALLGGRGMRRLPTGALPAAHAAAVVSQLLRQANGALWASLSELLGLLAEAAPDEFLKAVEQGLSREPSPVLAMFTDGPGFSALFASSPHTGLLWALEGVAWSAEHLLHATVLLGELAAREPGGQLGNRPARSLREIFLPWHPQTAAPLAGRLLALDGLRERWPEQAWELELALLPKGHDSAWNMRRPRFREWAEDHRRATPDESFAAVRELVPRVAEDAGESSERWAQVVGHLSTLSPSDRQLLLDRMATLNAEAMDFRERLALWRALVDEADRHRSFPTAEWSLDEEDVVALDEVAAQFEIRDVPERYARLFEHRVRIPGVPRDDYEALREATDLSQQVAVTEVLERHGLDGVLRLAIASKLPREVGWAVAGVAGDRLANELLPMLGGEEALAAMAAGWAARRLQDEGLSWTHAQAQALRAFPPAAQAAVLLELRPAGTEVWELLDGLDADTRNRYWHVVNLYGLATELVTQGVERLLEHDRPWAAVDVLASAVHRGDGLDLELTERALQAAATSEQLEATIDAAWEVGQVLDALERSGLQLDRLASLEFTFFALLDSVRAPTALQTAVISQPSLFVDLVRRVYRRADDADEDDIRPELASHAWQVLHELRRLPGSDEEGRLDGAALVTWVEDARRLLAAADRTDIGDEHIGQLLSNSFPDADGSWPAIPVRELVERLRSEHFEDGLAGGRFSARGLTTRGSYDGGGQEHAIAADLRQDATRLQVRWSRTSQLLRRLADDYEDVAGRLDRQAERRADEP